MTVLINPSMVGGVGSPEAAVVTSTKVMTNGDVLFTAVGDVQILNMNSECITNNGVGATTIQYSITPTVGSVTSISGVSASLTNFTAGGLVIPNGSNLATAPATAVSGVGLGGNQTTGVIFPTGTLTLVVAVGPTTGTWRHYMRYRPLETGAYVIGA